MSNRFFCWLGILLVAGLLLTPLADCYGKSPSDEPIVLRYSEWGSQRLANAFDRWFMEELKKRTNGRVITKTFWAESLCKGKAQLESMGAGLFDYGPFAPPYTPGKVPLSNVVSLPFMTDNIAAFSRAQMELNKLPELQSELAKWNVKFLYPGTLPSYELLSKSPVRHFEDLKGLRIRCYGYQEQAFHSAGAVPITMAPPEIFDALQKGTIDGTLFNFSNAWNYGFQDAVKYITLIGVGVSGRANGINLKTWNKLPVEVQKVIEELIAEAPKKWAEFIGAEENEGKAKFEEAGIEIISLPQADREKLLKIAAEPIWDGWVKEIEDKGLPGKKVFDTWSGLIRKYEKEYE
jgi:TRAP-type C4-dicarboxylate transport system substrate-binding protein